MRTHPGEKPFSFEVCGFAFYVSSQLNRHMRTHSGEKTYSCEVCASAFILGLIWKKTHSNSHWREIIFLWSLWISIFHNFPLKYNVNPHAWEKLFCEVCKSAFSKNFHLERNIRIITGESIFLSSVWMRICMKLFFKSTRASTYRRETF